MKAEILTENLEAAVSSLEKITAKNLSLPVLQCVLISGNKNKITIRATNLDLGVEITTSAKTITDGETAVPADTLKRFLSNIHDKKVVIEKNKNEDLFIQSESASTTIKTLPAEDFPTLPRPHELSFQIDAKNFSEGLQSVWYSASTGSLKPELSSVYIEKSN